ncbi:acyl-CoA thioesterase [Nonomuraea sp. NPDC059023]|uniref:acyl-CoA thioesterase n=1 Tax=unclassified Nonomuraea TaxID=2593643 RepID=UPI0036851758
MSFAVRIAVRGYELDTQGHVNGAVYHQYGDHARWECLRAAGITVEDLLASGVGPITLENTIRYHRELRGGDEVEVSCGFEWGAGKTFRIVQEYRHRDGGLAAELTSVGGLLDLRERRLVPDPAAHWRALASEPALLGL